MPRPLRIGYFGLPLGAILLLGDGRSLVFAALPPIAQPGRRRLAGKLAPDRIVDRFVDSNWEASIARLLREHPVDLIVSWFWTRRLPPAWLAQAPLGGIGVHPSLLPRHRGPDPYYAAIDQGDVMTGVSVHVLEPEYDTGAVLGVRSIPVGQRNAWQLARALDRPSLAALRTVVGEFDEGRPPHGVEQEAGCGSYAPAPEGDGLKVCWEWDTERILRRIRALSPVPGLALSHRGLPFFVTEARRVDQFIATLRPSEAFLGDRLILRTSDGAIAVLRATLEIGEETVTVDGRRLALLLQARPISGE